MAKIVMVDDGVAFDGATPDCRPMGGAEAAFLALAEGFAINGHDVRVRNQCAALRNRNGVEWAPLASGLPGEADLYIANRGHRLIGLVPRARKRIFWLHNPGAYLRKPRYFVPLARWRPILVISGEYHARTVPWWIPSGGRVVIPYGVADPFRHATPRDPPRPLAVFTSNPLRGLDWLLDLWERFVHPAVPEAEFHIYAGPSVYRAENGAKAKAMEASLSRAAALSTIGIRAHPPLPRSALITALMSARVMLYRGDEGETFCLSVAEAQALGIPAVVQPLGSLPERVVNGVTGMVTADESKFAASAISLLTDDMLWRRHHQAALACQRGLSWTQVATRFEELLT